MRYANPAAAANAKRRPSDIIGAIFHAFAKQNLAIGVSSRLDDLSESRCLDEAPSTENLWEAIAKLSIAISAPAAMQRVMPSANSTVCR